ncbi:MAG: UDP-N-acetylmuramoyl-tripeptide--D-alanyl-D-alanine ligase [Butyricicoccaceae bacterium]
MKPITLAQAAEFTGGAVVGDASAVIRGISTDSRTIPAQGMYLPIIGERFDGHDFIASAVQNGAAAVVSDRDVDCGVPVLRVEDTRRALLALAGGYRSLFDIPVVGVTGSVGKTTTKEMIASVLSQKLETLYTQGNLNNEIGMPLTVFRMEESTQAAVLEMGMNHFGEISRMTVQAQPTIGVITNIGTSHIEYLGSREGICKAKLELLEGLREGGTAVLCGDEPLLWDKRDALGVNTVYFGIDNPQAQITASNLVLSDEKVTFTVHAFDQTFDAVVYAAGCHNVLNALAATAVGLLCGLSTEEIAAGLAAFRSVGMRQRIYQEDGFTIFADCYNASPDSVEASLAVLRDLKVEGRRIAVLGGMRELGDYTREGHMRCGRCAAQCADAMYLYGDGAESYCEGAIEGGMDAQCIHIFDSHEALAAALKADTKQGDALLFKGSRYWAMEKSLEAFLKK